jgi:hypothetical protein
MGHSEHSDFRMVGSGMKKRYVISLTTMERDGLKNLIAAGAAPARKLMHARTSLKADQRPQRPEGNR